MIAKSNFYKTAWILPGLLSCAYLLGDVLNQKTEYYINTSSIPEILIIAMLAVVLSFLLCAIIKRDVKYCIYCCLSICSLTPFSVLYPWVISPGHLGIGFGGFNFFIEWLTKYPNLFKVNIEVLMGMVCFITASLVPGIFSYTYIGNKNRMILVLIAIIEVVFYAPVLVKLDFPFLFIVAMNIIDTISPIGYFVSFFGPVLRLVSCVIIIALTIMKYSHENRMKTPKNRNAPLAVTGE
jgi:hypothetical protein